MNVRNPMGVLHSFSIKNIFYDKIDFTIFYFYVTICPILWKNFKAKSDRN